MDINNIRNSSKRKLNYSGPKRTTSSTGLTLKGTTQDKKHLKIMVHILVLFTQKKKHQAHFHDFSLTIFPNDQVNLGLFV
jgi:hypothetical protein